MIRMKRMRHAGSVLALAATLAACTTVPITGRSSLNLIPEQELLSMSLTSYQDFLDQAKLSDDPEAVAMVRRVGERMAAATEAYLKSIGQPVSEFAWEFNVVEDEAANAWVMPGGKVVVYSGILPIAKDDAGLATVLGHEIAHVVAQHGNERMSQQLLAQLGGAALSVAVRDAPGQTQNLFMAAYGAGAQVGVLLPYSRLQESEADRIGLTLMAIAGYDPRAAIDFWQRMETEGGPRPPQFLSTHPSPGNRIANIERYLPEALAIYRK